jgi:hypothetical protein
MRAVKRSIAAVITVLSISAAGLAISASPAAAVPTFCERQSIGGYHGQFRVKCSGGTGYYRAVVTCSATATSSIHHRFQGWAEYTGSGRWSLAGCAMSPYPYLRNYWSETWD